jgi:hypothetical protein
MKYFILSLFLSHALFAQDTPKVPMTAESHGPTARAENFVIVLVKDIEHLSDTTHKHHHEAHKSSYKLVHINFDVNAKEGTTAVVGNKTVMLKIIDAQGKEEFDPAAGGGYFMLAGKESPYTMRQSFKYNGVSQHVDILYNNHKRFSKGLHLVEIYMDGFKIGEEHFVIK